MKKKQFYFKKGLAAIVAAAVFVTGIPTTASAAEENASVTAQQNSAVQLNALGSESGSDWDITKTDSGIKITWSSFGTSGEYEVYRAGSRYGTYEKIATVGDASYLDTAPNANKYENYYKVKETGAQEYSEPMSLELKMFGQNMYIFSDKDDTTEIAKVVDEIYKSQGGLNAGNGKPSTAQQFADERYALAFKPGDYTDIMDLDSPSDREVFKMGYYTHILGLGETPYDVRLNNVHVPAMLDGSNVTCNFWMSIENLTIADTNNNDDRYFDFNWSVSQAAPARRLYVERNTSLDENYGWASGGYIADSIFKGKLGSWTQQQYYFRNLELQNGAYGINWNGFFQGTTGLTFPGYPAYDLISGAGQTNWKYGNLTNPYTSITQTDVIREKPFLYLDETSGEYKVFVPSLRKQSSGVSWGKDNIGNGVSVDISRFYIAKEGVDNAQTINAALDAGKNIIFTPGVYYAEEPIQVMRANTIILGLGLATIIPTNAEAAIKVADVGGVSIAGLILDAGDYSKAMLVMGEEGCNKDHANNPSILQDIFVRVGGVHGGVASADQGVVINSNNVIGDDFWIWRADHGDGVGWNLNKAKNGVVVNGDDVTLYGLMCEHFQEYDVLWRGENGKTYFLQNEKCYDPVSQDDWMSHDGTKKGYAAYKVANNVKNHYAVGLGVYDVFINTGGASIFLDNAIEVPDTENVLIENACIVEIAAENGPLVGINHIINDTTAGISTGNGGKGYGRQALLSYNNVASNSLEDVYEVAQGQQADPVEEAGTAPQNDVKAEADINKEEKAVDETEKEITDYYEKLENGEIEESADLTILNEYIRQAEALAAADYEEESWSDLQAALTSAKAITQNNTQEVADLAADALKTAIDGLVKKSTDDQTEPVVKEVEKISLNVSKKTLVVNQKYKLKVSFTPTDAVNQTAAFKSSSTKIASVNSNGEITAKKVGTATITVTSANGKKAVCEITVKKKEVKKITLNVSKKTLGVKEKYKLKVKFTPVDATNQKVKFKSSNTKIASVNSKGQITAKKVGKATITVTAENGKKAVCKITVKKAPKYVKLNAKSKTLKVKKTFQLKAGLSAKSAGTVTYTSSNKRVATVDAKGVIKAVKKGKVTITAKTYNGKKAKITIRVK